MFKRKIMDEILKWENSLSIKKRALIIKGLRQVGKTTIVKNYCNGKYDNVVYINFMDNTSLKKIFDHDLVVNDIVRDLSAAIPTARFVPNKTVIIFDKIEPHTSDKYDVDKSFKLIDGNISIQGKVVTIPLYTAYLIN